MTPDGLLGFMRAQRYAVEASTSGTHAPQAAVVGIAVSDAFELVFDTLRGSRKATNLRARPAVAFVIGGTHDGNERTMQYEGMAEEPTGDELRRIQEIYFGVFPDGRERLDWPDLIHVLVRPTWIRYSDYGAKPPLILEFDSQSLGFNARWV